MRQSPKQNRARSKNGRKANGPSLNRVYESSGPEGKVRGTPQQIIEKYLSLARDKATSGDRVLSESFLQHAEHYVRVLGAAQAAHGAHRRDEHGRDDHGRDEHDGSEAEQDIDQDAEIAAATGAAALAVIGEDEARTDIVDTPENAAADRRATRRRPASAEGDDGEEGPRRRRRPQRRSRATPADGEAAAANGEAEDDGGSKRAAPRDSDGGSDSVQELGGAAG